MIKSFEFFSNKLLIIFYLSLITFFIKLFDPSLFKSLIAAITTIFPWNLFNLIAVDRIFSVYFFFSVFSGVLYFWSVTILNIQTFYYKKINRDKLEDFLENLNKRITFGEKNVLIIDKLSVKCEILSSIFFIWFLIFFSSSNWTNLYSRFIQLSWLSILFFILNL